MIGHKLGGSRRRAPHGHSADKKAKTGDDMSKKATPRKDGRDEAKADARDACASARASSQTPSRR